jgi:hypothetical protein
MARCRSRVNLVVAQCQCRSMLVTMLLSPTSDDAVESTLAMTRCHCRTMLVTALPGRLSRDAMYMSSQAGAALPRRLGCGAMVLSSYIGDGAAEATWPRCNVGVRSCWRSRY